MEFLEEQSRIYAVGCAFILWVSEPTTDLTGSVQTSPKRVVVGSRVSAMLPSAVPSRNPVLVSEDPVFLCFIFHLWSYLVSFSFWHPLPSALDSVTISGIFHLGLVVIRSS